MKAIELKFLLKLLGHEGYQAPISKLTPSDKRSESYPLFPEDEVKPHPG